MNDVCPSAEKCPIFTGILKGKDFTTQYYLDKFCNAGEAGRAECRRWQVKQRYGRCPENVLPNSLDSMERMGKIYELKNIGG